MASANDPRPALTVAHDPSHFECGCLMRQSPTTIDLNKAHREADYEIDLETSDITAPLSVKTILKEHHTLMVDTPLGELHNQVTIKIKGVEEKFQLENIHFHTGAEHVVVPEGADVPDPKTAKREAAELHVVYLSEGGNRAVIGVILHEQPEPNPAIQKILDAYNADTSVTINPAELIPDNKIAYVRGSLTTPNYDERVHWMLSLKEGGVSHDQLLELQAIAGEKGNSRLLHPPGDRDPVLVDIVGHNHTPQL